MLSPCIVIFVAVIVSIKKSDHDFICSSAYYTILVAAGIPYIEHWQRFCRQTEDAYSSEYLVISHMGRAYLQMMRLVYQKRIKFSILISHITMYFDLHYSSIRTLWLMHISHTILILFAIWTISVFLITASWQGSIIKWLKYNAKWNGKIG